MRMQVVGIICDQDLLRVVRKRGEEMRLWSGDNV